MAKLHSLLECAFIMSTYNNLLLKAKGRKKLVKLQYVIGAKYLLIVSSGSVKTREADQKRSKALLIML
jgi:hypothetical protein